MEGEQDRPASRDPARRNEVQRLLSTQRLRSHIHRLGSHFVNTFGGRGSSSSGSSSSGSSSSNHNSNNSSSGPSSHPPQQHNGHDPHGTNPAPPPFGVAPCSLPPQLYSLQKRRVRKRYMDQLVMNYLVIKGHKEVAECLSRESGAAPPVDLTTIEARMHVRRALMAGEVDKAMAHVIESDPRLLEKDKGLAFALKVQKLVEMIRRRVEQREGGMEGEEGEDDEAILAFARQELAPLSEEQEGGGGGGGGEGGEGLQILEAAMTLLVFGPAATGAAPGGKGGGEAEGGLLDLSRRAATADRVNAAILQSQGQDSEPVLPGLLKKLRAAEVELATEMMRRD